VSTLIRGLAGLSLALSLAYFVLFLPADADGHTKTVTAQVVVQTVAVSVSPDSINYGPVPFGSSKSSADLSTPITFTVTNTGNVNEVFQVYGTNATGGLAGWTLNSTNIADNQFRHSITGIADGTSVAIGQQYLEVSLQEWANKSGGYAPTHTQKFTSRIYMPASGDATGTKTTSIVIVAVAVP
jgi:hypothetical protein